MTKEEKTNLHTCVSFDFQVVIINSIVIIVIMKRAIRRRDSLLH